MKFGYIKSLIENKFVESYKNNTLKKDLEFFKKNILSDNSFSSKMYLYDKLSESFGLSKDDADFMVNQVIIECEKHNLKKTTISNIKNWTKGLVCENNYETIDTLIESNSLIIESKIDARKKIIKSLTEQRSIKENTQKVPLSTLIKAANNSIKKHLDTLDESTKNRVFDLIKPTEDKFNTLKENTIKNLDSLISMSQDEEIKTYLKETKEKVSVSKYSGDEYTKLFSLNEGLSSN